MNRCSSSHGSSYGPCSCCGFFQAPANSFSMFFMDEVDHHGYPYTSPSSSSVDCTLSLGTPSTRQSTSYNFMDHHHSSSSNHHRASTSSSSGSKKLSWDIFQSKKSSSSATKSSRGGNGGNGNANNLNGESLLARRCANCDTTSTPLWRNGPRGPKSLCNACGIRYKKEERRAANSSSTSTTTSNATASSTIMDSHHYMGHHHMNTWGHQGNEFRFIEDNDGDSTDTTAIPFLSWRLNVPVHDYS